MPQPVALQYSDQSVGLPANYTLPPGQAFDFSAVTARINGAAASGDFLVVLDLLSQDDKVIASSRIDQEFASGDTAVVSFAPDFRRKVTSTTPPPAPIELPWARRSKGYDAADQNVSNSTIVTATFNHDYNMGAGESGNAYFLATGNNLRLLVAGVYAIVAEVQYVEAHNFNRETLISDGLAPAQHTFATSTDGTNAIFDLAHYVHNYAANVNLSLAVWQNSGALRHIDACYLQATYLGAYTGVNFTTMNPDQ